LRQVVIMARVLTVNDVLDGLVTLDIECLDRIYLNAYVPILQTSSQVVAFLSGHLGFPFPSPVLFRQLGDRFRKAVVSFSDAMTRNHLRPPRSASFARSHLSLAG
jgi:hypothetical protein